MCATNRNRTLDDVIDSRTNPMETNDVKTVRDSRANAKLFVKDGHVLSEHKQIAGLYENEVDVHTTKRYIHWSSSRFQRPPRICSIAHTLRPRICPSDPVKRKSLADLHERSSKIIRRGTNDNVVLSVHYDLHAPIVSA